MQTRMRVDTATRDALARVAANDLGGVSLDYALRVLLFEHDSQIALARLQTDPAALRNYQQEAAELN